MKRTLSKNEKEALTSGMVSSLTGCSVDIASVYLFGSFLDEGPFSDIDIGILLKNPATQSLDLELALEDKLARITNHPVDVRVLNQAPLAFCHSVVKTGRVIYDPDPSFRADFQGRILKEYFDFAPYHRQYLREVVNAPV